MCHIHYSVLVPTCCSRVWSHFCVFMPFLVVTVVLWLNFATIGLCLDATVRWRGPLLGDARTVGT